jgi:hypothetical protein
MLTDFRILASSSPKGGRPTMTASSSPKAGRPDITASSTPKAGRPTVTATTTYTLRDLELVFGRREMDVLWRKWRSEHGFPQPLPWSRRPLRWNAEAVLRWKANREAEAGSLGIETDRHSRA